MGGRRILIVSPYFYPEGGGLERYAFEMAKVLSNKNQVEVLCMTRGESCVEEVGGIRVHRVRPDVIISNTPISLRFVLRAAKMIRDADIVIAHTPVPFAADVASFLAKLRKIPITVVYHTPGLKKGAGLLDFISSVYSATLERLTLRGTEIIAVSKTVWEHLRELGYNPSILPPKIDLPRHHSPKSVSKRKVILFVGQIERYHRFKNLDLVIKAFSLLSAQFPEWGLWIVGGGNMLDEYRHLVIELGVGSRVKFFGRITNREELAGIYSQAGVLVLPSSFESFGMVVAEALAFGVPVIVSPNAGAKVLVESGKNGFVLRDLSISSLVNVLKLVMDNPKLLRKLSSRSTTDFPLRRAGLEKELLSERTSV